MTKIDMVNLLCDQLGFMKRQSTDIVESILEIIKSDLEKGNPVMISGFGKWTVKSKRERKGRNPKTGEEMPIKARKVISLKYSQALSKAMNPE